MENLKLYAVVFGAGVLTGVVIGKVLGTLILLAILAAAVGATFLYVRSTLRSGART